MATLTLTRENPKEALHKEPVLGTTIVNVPPVFREIESFQFLEESWDGEDAQPISSKVTSLANSVVLKAFNKYKISSKWHEPEVAPTIDGGIDLEWELGDRRLLLFFNPNGNIEVLVRRNKEVLGSFAVTPDISNLNLIQPQIDWVLG